MNSRPLTAAILLIASPVFAHRLDEYLQATMISLEKDRVGVRMLLTPGVAVSLRILKGIDTNDDGVISGAEQQAYTERLLQDVTLKIDGHPLRPRLVSMAFPAVEEIKEGLGAIQMEFVANLPPGGGGRKLVFENHHQSGIAAYLVNCLAPVDPEISVVAQNRNQQQSFYELDYVQGRAPVISDSLQWWRDVPVGPCAALLLVLARLLFVWRRRSRKAIG